MGEFFYVPTELLRDARWRGLADAYGWLAVTVYADATPEGLVSRSDVARLGDGGFGPSMVEAGLMVEHDDAHYRLTVWPDEHPDASEGVG